MIIAINYADKSFQKAQKLNLETAKNMGRGQNNCLYAGGYGYGVSRAESGDTKCDKGKWLLSWKPYFLNKAYQELKEGDYLIYTDAGSIYVNKIQYLIDCMEQEKMEIMVFSLQRELLEKQYTKRDAFVLMQCDAPQFTDTPQSIGGYVLFKKSDFVEQFLSEDLNYAQDERIIAEIANTQGLPNYPEFIAHRHDQSVWSLMVKKYGLKRFRDPSQYGLCNHYETAVEERSTFPQIIDSHRMNVGSLRELKWRRSKCGRVVDKVKK